MKNLIKEFEKRVPLSVAEEWDNVGYIIKNGDKEINKVLLTLDITNVVIEKAIVENVDLIISHHPLIFSKINKIKNDSLLGNKIITLIQNKIDIYAAHTNLDFVKNGLNDYFFEILNLDGKIVEKEDDNVRYFNLKKEIDAKDLAKYIKNKFEIKNVRLVGNKKVKRLALVTGDGSSFLNKLVDVDMYITGDLKHHNSLDYKEKGMVLLDLDHYGSEKIVVKLLNKIIREIDNNLEIIEFLDEEVFEYI